MVVVTALLCMGIATLMVHGHRSWDKLTPNELQEICREHPQVVEEGSLYRHDGLRPSLTARR
jgi:hypothetical protein